MPFFSRNTEPEDEAVPTHHYDETQTDTKQGRHGLFGSLRREPSPSPSAATGATAATNGTRTTADRRSVDNSTTSSLNNGGGGSSRRSFLQRSFGNGNDADNAHLDPSIIQARERVLSAESAERDADRALEIARREVREAREHAKRLEMEAKEEARLAKVKQFHAREVTRRAKPLGRHDR